MDFDKSAFDDAFTTMNLLISRLSSRERDALLDQIQNVKNRLGAAMPMAFVCVAMTAICYPVTWSETVKEVHNV